MRSHVLCLFTRTPRPGSCKTRLIPELGADGACAAHIELVEGQLRRLDEMCVSKSLWITETSESVRSWARQFGYEMHEQMGADLGERMGFAFADEFARGAERVVLIGGDCPEIDARYVDDAFNALLTHDLVLGPAVDGGYGLIGLNCERPVLFCGVPWGAGRVLDKTLEIASQSGLATVLLSEIWDVDTLSDWNRYLNGRGRSSDSGD